MSLYSLKQKSSAFACTFLMMPCVFTSQRVFDFLGFQKAPNANVDRYKEEIKAGMYPPEVNTPDDDGESSDTSTSDEPVLPWAYSPTQDSATYVNLVEELLHTVIILITVRA